jgi:hypothetical protein
LIGYFSPQLQSGSSGTEENKPVQPQSKAVSDFRNKFEKFGPPKPVRKPSIPGPGSANVALTIDAAGGDSQLEKACKEAKELAEQLQAQLTQLEKCRMDDRDELTKKMEQLRAQMETELKAVKGLNSNVRVHQVLYKKNFETYFCSLVICYKLSSSCF